jgi:bacterioferritin
VRGETAIIDLLNEVLTAELTAINQYFVDGRMFSNWGYERLGEHFQHESIDEMKDAQQLIDRILLLEGVPNLQRLGSVRVGETPEEKLRLALDLELEAVARLNQGIRTCNDAGDHGSRLLLEEILAGEERHVDWLEGQLHALGELGSSAYLAQQLRD